jgi:UDP-N-acetylglucosamine 1-carboxyvinyltransferase
MNSEEVFVINGGNKISGCVPIGGAKNSVLKLMAASVLCEGETCIENVPCISDVRIMEKVLTTIGAKVTRGPERGLDKHTVFIDTSNLTSFETPYELVAKMRASISILGPLIARFGRARVAMPGGCQIGSRKLDMHITSLEALGVKFRMDHGYIEAHVDDGGLCGNEIILDFPSVGATENLMMAATRAKGKTVIHNAACEPEIVDLANFLTEMGAHIEGIGTPDYVIEGTDEEFIAPHHKTVGDRIEAGTFLTAGALMGGPVTVQGVNPAHLAMAIKKLTQMGCNIECGEDEITVSCDGRLKAVDIQTLPHPGFPTDLQAQFMVLCAVADGNSIITENVFENRFMFASELSRMGAQIRIDGHHALITGVDELAGAPVVSTDLRGGAAIVVAALAAQGQTVVGEIHHIDRGYEDYADKLRAIGADVSRTTRACL